MNHPKIFTLLQILLDTTPLPRDVLEYMIVPDLLPSTEVARQKMQSVLRSIHKLNGCICAHCREFSVSVATTDRRCNQQPFSQKETSSYVPFCKGCKKLHVQEVARWKKGKIRTNHVFYYYNPSGRARGGGIFDLLARLRLQVAPGQGLFGGAVLDLPALTL